LSTGDRTGAEREPEPEPEADVDVGVVVVRVDAELEPLIPRFLEKRRAEVEVLRRAADDGDLATLRALGHALKGTAGGYGFDHLTDLGARLERAAVAGSVAEARDAVAEIQAYLPRVRVVFV
jgi:HPt (histidine-containing phosphotransfer) domain-containing protein